MDQKDNNQVFSLEEIMREFGADPDVQEPAPEAAEEVPEEPVSADATIVMEPVRADDTIVMEPVSADDTMVMEPVSMDDTMVMEPVNADATIVMEPVTVEAAPAGEPEQEVSAEVVPEETEPEQTEQIAEVPEAEAAAEDAPEAAAQTAEEAPETPGEEAPEEEPAPAEILPEQTPAPKAIPFRSRLSELKRQLVAGPEKRYYDLSEMGLGRVQIAVFLTLLIVVLCAGATTLYAFGMVLENRLRLMVFSQILAMMLSALLGCYVLMDGIVDLFTGKFSLNSMLFLTLAACAADAVFCLQELRVPCCAAFSLEMAMALWNRSMRRSTEMGQMDTLRKANRLGGITRVQDYFNSKPGYVRTEGRLEDFMDNYSLRTGPEKVLNIYALLSVLACIGIAVLAGMRHGMSLAIQVFSTSMLVAVPAGAFISQSRPAAILQRRLHMFGTVLCGWKGVKLLSGKGAFPLTDRELFPLGTTKLNGVKFLNGNDPDLVISCAASMMQLREGGLEPVFTQLLKSRNGRIWPVEDYQILEDGMMGRVRGKNMLMGSALTMEAYGVEIPDNARVENAVYFAVEDTLAAVFAISYSRTKAAAGGLVSLAACRKIRPLVLCRDFLITPEMIRSRFGVRVKRFDFPEWSQREALAARETDPELPCAALTTQQNLAAAVYAVTGAQTLNRTCRVGMAMHLAAGVLGLLIMAALAYLGDLELLSPFNILLYQLVWLVPGLLITEWTRTV